MTILLKTQRSKDEYWNLAETIEWQWRSMSNCKSLQRKTSGTDERATKMPSGKAIEIESAICSRVVAGIPQHTQSSTVPIHHGLLNRDGGTSRKQGALVRACAQAVNGVLRKNVALRDLSPRKLSDESVAGLPHLGYVDCNTYTSQIMCVSLYAQDF